MPQYQSEEARGINFDQIDAMRKGPEVWTKAFHNWINRRTGKDGIEARRFLSGLGLEDKQIYAVINYLLPEQEKVDKTTGV